MHHFVQSDAWARLQEARGRTVVRLSGNGWSAQGFIERGRLNSRLYVPYGPELDRAEALPEALGALRAAARRAGAAFVRVEPTLTSDAGPALPADTLRDAGLHRAPRVQPEYTQRIRLDRPLEEVWADMSKSNRNLHRNFGKKGLRVRRSADPADIEHLIRLLGEVSARTGMHAHQSEYLRTQARTFLPAGDGSVYLVDLEGAPEPVAAALVFDDPQRRIYAHAAADTAHRRLSPGTILVTTMIEDAHAAGQREFDLYGVVPPEVRDHPWSGFSDFKRSFGGQQVPLSGTWEMAVRPISYGVYRLARRVLGDRV